MGSINGKDIEVIKAPTSSFATVDLTKYVPTSTYSEYSFEGWSIDGKSYVKSISAEDFEKVPHDIIEVVGIWKKNTFDSNSSLNFRLDANVVLLMVKVQIYIIGMHQVQCIQYIY